MPAALTTPAHRSHVLRKPFLELLGLVGHGLKTLIAQPGNELGQFEDRDKLRIELVNHSLGCFRRNVDAKPQTASVDDHLHHSMAQSRAPSIKYPVLVKIPLDLCLASNRRRGMTRNVRTRLKPTINRLIWLQFPQSAERTDLRASLRRY